MNADTARAEPKIVRVTGAIAMVRPARDASLYELVRVGHSALLGEVIRVDGDEATIQVYEETTGLGVGEPVQLTGTALTVELGPGLLGAILDGVGRPLDQLAARAGDFLRPGTTARTLDSERRWAFEPSVEVGAQVDQGDVIGAVAERPGLVHRVLVPPGVSGTVRRIARGEHTIRDPVGELADGTPLMLTQRWPVRRPRPAARRLRGDRPLWTGQRVLDFLFPVVEGGSVAVPGGFGTGKTVIEQGLAKFADADVVVFIGCGERGNEMADLLDEFPRLVDPKTGRSILDRTTLVVNTSNMPIAAREASVYLGLTIAEYYRDMGYRVAVMADSLSRWAEALREIAARLSEMPGEESYPTYLGARMGKLFERAGRVRALGRPERDGAVTFIGAISPPGGDLSEPVTQASLRVVSALWALDAALAQRRQFPAVDWETSYSLSVDTTAPWFQRRAGQDWLALRSSTLALLQRDAELRDVAALVGASALEDRDRALLEAARMTREVVLGQSAHEPNDASSSLQKTLQLARAASAYHDALCRAVDAGALFGELDLAPARRALIELRSAADADVEARAAAAAAAIGAIAQHREAAPTAAPRSSSPQADAKRDAP
jgi:V/A-type H+-transporting ATPase subunit A